MVKCLKLTLSLTLTAKLLFLGDQIADFLEISSSETANMSLQYININHEMPVSKLENIVNLAPYTQIGQTFPIVMFTKRLFFLKKPPAKVAHLNKICQDFKSFGNLLFLSFASGRIGALLGVNTFSYTYLF